jgi:RNA polymerase sigma factor (sigma-70 family)
MDYTKATDDQLKTIIRYDHSCSPSLLEGVVKEMLNRYLFDAMIKACVKSIMDIKTVETIYKMSLEDFLQIGRTVIYTTVQRYDETKNTAFFTFIHLVVRSKLIHALRRLQRTKRDERYNISLNKKVSESDEFSYKFPSNVNVERYVVTKLFLEEQIPKLNEFQKQVLTLRWKGYQFAEISQILGRSSMDSCRKTYERALANLRKGA